MLSRLLSAVALIFAGGIQAFGQSFNCTVQNATVSNDTLYYDVYVQQTGTTTIYLGTSDFVLTFNSANFTNPVVTPIQQGESGSRIETWYTLDASLQSTNRAVINLLAPTITTQILFNNRVQVVSATAPGTMIGRVAISGITNPAGFAELAWRLATPNNTVFFEFTNANPWPMYDSTSTGAFTNPGPIPLPVELTSFTATVTGTKALLRWQTATEKNNYGFYIQRKKDLQVYADVADGFVAGHGTTNVAQSYSFTDENSAGGPWSYRLKQVDLDGSFAYYYPGGENGPNTEVPQIEIPTEFTVLQNYPNPFNPSTTIRYGIPAETHVTVEVFNLIGQRVATLVSGVQVAGYYNLRFDAASLTSGLYFYRVSTKESSFLKKMMVLK